MDDLHLTLPEYVYAGKAYFTVKNEQSGNEFSYLVEWIPRYSSYLIKSLNTRDGSYFKLGYYNSKKGLVLWTATTSAKVFSWYHKHILADTLPHFISTIHFDRCCRCGAKLRNEKSIERGFGDECASIIFQDKPKLFDND